MSKLLSINDIKTIVDSIMDVNEENINDVYTLLTKPEYNNKYVKTQIEIIIRYIMNIKPFDSKYITKLITKLINHNDFDTLNDLLPITQNFTTYKINEGKKIETDLNDIKEGDTIGIYENDTLLLTCYIDKVYYNPKLRFELSSRTFIYNNCDIRCNYNENITFDYNYIFDVQCSSYVKELINIIREDNIDELIKYTSNNIFTISENEQPILRLPMNYRSDNIEHHQISEFIELAIIFGSIKCFKMLFLSNGINIKTDILSNELMISNNLEIIHILIQNNIIDFITLIKSSILYHNNDIFNYCLNNYDYSDDYKGDLAISSIVNWNYYSFEILNTKEQYIYNKINNKDVYHNLHLELFVDNIIDINDINPIYYLTSFHMLNSEQFNILNSMMNYKTLLNPMINDADIYIVNYIKSCIYPNGIPDDINFKLLSSILTRLSSRKVYDYLNNLINNSITKYIDQKTGDTLLIKYIKDNDIKNIKYNVFKLLIDHGSDIKYINDSNESVISLISDKFKQTKELENEDIDKIISYIN